MQNNSDSETPRNSTDRPTLNKNISVEDFRDFYWLKEELVAFCREHGLDTAGAKTVISQRVEKFLASGEIDGKGARKSIKRSASEQRKKEDVEPLSLSTVITEKYRSSEANRAFFKSVIGPHFHFTTHFMQFCRENVGKTYQDAVNEWYAEEEHKNNKDYKTEIAPQFEYNQYIRDFLAQNRGKSLKDAISSWNSRKKERSSQRYTTDSIQKHDDCPF